MSGLGEHFWCESSAAEGGGSKRVPEKWLTASQALACWGYKAVVAKPWFFSSLSCWVRAVYGQNSQAACTSWPGMSGKMPWDWSWGCLLRKASPRQLHEIPGRQGAKTEYCREAIFLNKVSCPVFEGWLAVTLYYCLLGLRVRLFKPSQD